MVLLDFFRKFSIGPMGQEFFLSKSSDVKALLTTPGWPHLRASVQKRRCALREWLRWWSSTSGPGGWECWRSAHSFPFVVSQVWSLTQFYSVLDFHNHGSVWKSAFSTNKYNQGLRQLFLTASFAPGALHFLETMKFWKPHTRQDWGPLTSAMSTQKAFKGPEIKTKELLGGTEDNSVSQRGDRYAP